MATVRVQGRTMAEDQLRSIQQLIQDHPSWGRTRLSRHLAEQWNWRNAAGQLKDMAARSLLLKLEKRGWIQLPKPQSAGGGSRPARGPNGWEPALFAEPCLTACLSELLPIHLEVVASSAQRQVLSRLLDEHHYRGYRRAVGENIPYLARDQGGRLLACLVFGAAAWKCAPRDQYIGWKAAVREKHLPYLANNMRLLILPWVRVNHLGSHLLGLAAHRLSSDWERKYGHPIFLLETFVERARFSGACYLAANWRRVGQTQSRSRNDPNRTLRVSSKDVYLYPLTSLFRDRLLTPISTP
jgi:hypothetical protein